jgi:HlyD family secretion protein
MKRIATRILSALFLAALVLAVIYAFRPRPVTVDTSLVVRGPLETAIVEDGQTRARDRFTVAAPVSGFLSRITLREGDRVARGAILATVRPLPVDSREEAEIRARIASAEALEREAQQQVARAETTHEQSKRDLARAEMLVRDDVIPMQKFEEAQSKEAMLAEELEMARHRASSAAAEVSRARAGLIAFESRQSGKSQDALIQAPVESRILQILEKSERVVQAGTPILVLSNPNRLEIVADLLSTDAVNVKPGAPVWVENWGGPQPLRARVRTVEPYGFTKVSALGVEEQRVNVIADFLDPAAVTAAGLGDGYRLDVRIVVWENPAVTKAPASALFRSGPDWNVFVVEGGAARLRRVEVGHRSALEVEILKGLSDGEEAVLHPTNDIQDGQRLMRR